MNPQSALLGALLLASAPAADGAASAPPPHPPADAPHFACNAHSPDGKHVLIQSSATRAMHALERAGFSPIPIDTSEFIKSGGSVFCLKLMLF